MYLNVGLGYTSLLLKGAALQFALRNCSIPIEEAYLLNIAADDMPFAIAGQDAVDRAYSVVFDLDSGVLSSMWTETRNIRIFPGDEYDEAAIREPWLTPPNTDEWVYDQLRKWYREGI